MRSAADWAGALGLRKAGSEFHGPCPLCGGRRRFHVRDSRGGSMVGCRGCIDGQPKPVRRARVAEAATLAFGSDRQPKPRRTATEAAALRKRDADEQALLHERRADAAQITQDIINHASLGFSDYLTGKGLGHWRWRMLPDARSYSVLDPTGKRYAWRTQRNVLVVPMWSQEPKQRAVLRSVQLIAADGHKIFIPGGRAKGCFHDIRRSRGKGRTWIVEGLATGMSVAMALDKMQAAEDDGVRCVFSAGNVPQVARHWAGDIVVADHDKPPKDRPDKAPAGEDAAVRSRCAWVMPPALGDANDMHQRAGLDALAALLRSVRA